MKKRVLSLIFTLTAVLACTFGLSACEKGYNTTETDSLIAQLQTDLQEKESKLNEKITALIAEYTAKDTELLAQITAHQQAITALQAEYSAKVAELMQADEDNEQALEDLTAEYTAKITEIESAIATINTTIANNKAELNNKITALTTAYETKMSEIDELLQAIQNTDSNQTVKIAELLSKIADLENATRIISVEFASNGDLIVNFADGSTQTVKAPQQHKHTFGDWVVFTTDSVPCENRLFFHTCNDCHTIEWKQGTYDDHSFTTVTTLPTCQAQGYDTKTCDICGKVETTNYTATVGHAWATTYSSDNTYHWIDCATCDEIKDKQTHTISKVEAKEATCSQAGNEEYFACDCGKTFADEAGNTPIDTAPTIPQKEHNFICEVAEPKYLATSATCEEKATYYKSCTCGKKGTTTFEYGDFAPHKSFDLIISDSALVEQTADTYYLSCTDCGELSQETTTVNEFIGVENGMAFTQLAGFSLAIPENSTLQLKALKVKLTDGTLKAEYTGGSFDNFNTAFNALSPKYTYLLEYTVFNGTDSETYDGVVDFSINTVDTVAIAQTQSQMETNLMPTGSKAQLIYTESNIGGRKSAYEWTTGSSSSTQGNATISLTNNTLNKKNAVTGKYLYFDIYTTHDFPLTFIDATSTNGTKHYLYQNSYDFIKKYDATTGAKITSNAQSTWKGKWVTVEIQLQCDWYFDSNYRGFTIPASNDYGLSNTDSKHIYLDNFRISTYSIYAQIDAVSECSEHNFTATVPQPKYLAQKATCQAPASFYKSCSVCGALGTETFTAGNIGTHDYTQNTASEFLATKATCLTPAKYYYSCSTCSYKHAKTFTYGTVGDHECNREVASEQYLVSEKTPTQNAIYYKSCVCGLAGTDTFEYDDTLPESVYVMANPNKTEYANGETFDKTGMVVMAYLRNGEEVTVTGYTLSHTTLTYPLDSITISYLGVQTEVAVTVYEFTVADVIAEVANAYDRQSSQIHYDQYNSRRHLTVSPEEATAQRTIYLDCSSFVNSVYRETFGVNIIPYMENSLGSMPDGSWTPSTSNFNSYAKNYTDNVDVVGFWQNADYTTTAEQQELLASVRSMLQVGDVLNYRHHAPGSSSYKGHVYIYLGDDTFIHHAGAGSYHVDSSDPALSYDEEGAPYNSIITSDADELFTDTSNTRYLFKKTTSDEVSTFMVLRPLARGLSLTQKAINRMQIAGLSMEKVSSVGINSAVRTGDTITYTITLDNKVSKTHSAVVVSDILPTGTEFVEGTTGVVVDGSNLSWTVNVGSKAKVTLTYTVRVTQTQAGALIVSDSTFVGGLNLGTITHSVAGYTVEQTNAVAEKANAFVTAQRAFSDPIAFAQALYSETLGVSIFNYATTANALADVIDVTNNKARTDTALSKMIAPNLYGGLDIASGQYKLEDTQRCRLVTEAQLAVGDIILAEWSGGSRVYVYIGNSKLVCCSTTNLTCHELTIGTNIYSGADNILVSFIAYDGYAVIRPSMVVTA